MTPLSPSDHHRDEITPSPVPDDPPPPPTGSAGPSRTVVATAAGGDTRPAATREREREGPLGRVLSGMAALLVAAVIAGKDAVVPRKKRSARARAETASSSSRWSAFIRLPAPPPPAAPGPRCHDCAATETPQWRSGPMGPRTLCNNCGVKRRAAGERWGPPRRRRRGATTVTVSDQQPPPQQQQIPMMTSPPADSPAWQGPLPEGYRMARGNAARRNNNPPSPAADSETEQPPTPPQENNLQDDDPEYSPAPPPKKNKKTNKAAAAAGKRCVHCGSSETPQWRGGPAGPRSLCNACGVRNRQGRLLPEYRPLASPGFDRGTHASLHTEVLLRRRRQPRQQPLVDDDSQDVDRRTMPRYLFASNNLRVGAPINNVAAASASNATGAPGMSVTGGTGQVDEAVVWLDPFLLDGPAPPLIVDEPDWMMGVVVNRDLPGGSSAP
ncbi:unnamed protein product [Urochloa humidicola]